MNRKLMAEYLSPGVYVEEFDSGPAPMQGVGTSTAGFIGLAEKGPVSRLSGVCVQRLGFYQKIWRISAEE